MDFKTLRGSPKGKAQRGQHQQWAWTVTKKILRESRKAQKGQYLLAVCLGRYK